MSCRKRRSSESSAEPTNFEQSFKSKKALTRQTAEALAVSKPGVQLTPSERKHVRRATVYPFIYDTRAPLVRRRVSEADTARYRALVDRMAA